MEKQQMLELKKAADETRKKVSDATNLIKEQYHFSMSTGIPSRLQYTVATQVVNGKMLLFGNPGRGKTTLAETVQVLFEGRPRSVVISLEAHGNPDGTAEEFIGIPNIENKGRGVIWQRFAQSPYIVDEINRIQKLSILLDSIDRGNFSYMGHTLMARKGPLFATANWPDRETAPIIPPIADRFHVAVVVNSPKPQIYALDPESTSVQNLEDKDTTREMLNLYDRYQNGQDLECDNDFYEEKMQQLDKITDKFRKTLEKRLGISLPTREDMDQTRQYIANMPLTEEAKLFLVFTASEMSCPECGEKQPGKESCFEGTHFINSDYAFSHLTRTPSYRFHKQSLELYSRAFAWMNGDEKVTQDHIAAVAPYALWHRVGFQGSFMAKNNKQRGHIDLELSKLLVRDGVQKRFTDNLHLLKEVFGAYLRKESLDQYDKKLDHPILMHLKNDQDEE